MAGDNPRIKALNGDPSTLPKQEGWRYVEGGEMQVRIGHDRAGVFIDFGKNVSAFKLNPDQALTFARKIEAEAMAAKIGL